MKFAISAVPVIALLTVAAVGCQNDAKTKAPAAGASVLDVTPAPAPHRGYSAAPAYAPPTGPTVTQAPSYPPLAPVATGPQFTEPAVPEATPAKPAPAATVASGGGSYTVQKGDSLSSIARQRYGNPSKWKQIAAANPNVNPNALKVGQKLAMP